MECADIFHDRPRDGFWWSLPREDYLEIARLLRDQVDLPDDPDWYASMNMVLAATTIAAKEHPALAYERQLEPPPDRSAAAALEPVRIYEGTGPLPQLRGGVFPRGARHTLRSDHGDGAVNWTFGQEDRRATGSTSKEASPATARHLRPGAGSCRRCRRKAMSSSCSMVTRRRPASAVFRERIRRQSVADQVPRAPRPHRCGTMATRHRSSPLPAQAHVYWRTCSKSVATHPSRC